MIQLKRFAALIATLVIVAQQPALAEESYPTRPIRLIVGFAAGSSADVAARIVSRKFGDLLGQTVIVENRPGAGRSPNLRLTMRAATSAVSSGTCWGRRSSWKIAPVPAA